MACSTKSTLKVLPLIVALAFFKGILSPSYSSFATLRYLEGSQLGVVRKKLGVVQKFNVVRTLNLTLDHAQLWTTLSLCISSAYEVLFYFRI